MLYDCYRHLPTTYEPLLYFHKTGFLFLRGYEQETNCSGIFRTSSKLPHTKGILSHQRLNMSWFKLNMCILKCRIYYIYANYPATAWADTLILIYLMTLLYFMYRKRCLEDCKSAILFYITVKLCDHVGFVLLYIFIFVSRPQQKHMT